MAQLIKLIQENKNLKNTLKQYQEVYGCCPHLDDSLLKGGYRVVNNIEERDAIPCCYRKQGMVVMVIEDTEPYTEYYLDTTTCDNVWVEIENGGIGEVLWGLIGGDIEDQSDLMNLLDLKANISDIPVNISELINDLGYLTTETDPTVPLHVKGILTTDISNWNTAYTQRIQTFTTTGNSGAATFTGNTLNIPNYTLSGLGGVPSTRSLTINGVTQDLSANRTWNISPDYSFLTDNRHIKKVGLALTDSNIQDTSVGSEVLGRLDSTATVERRTQASANTTFTIDLSNPSGHFDLTLTGNTIISFSNMIDTNKSTVITLVISGNYSLMFPSWLKPMPYNDSYYSNSASAVNLVTILIRNGGGSPQGMYSLTNVNIA